LLKKKVLKLEAVMLRISMVTACAAFLLSVQPSFAEMDHMKDMDKHMMEQMGGRMQEQAQDKAQAQESKAMTAEAEAEGVTVKVTYANPGAAMPLFDVVLDTHSVELDRYRFEDIVVLRDKAGDELKPRLVSSKGSGHHREAALEFKDADLAGAGHAELVVKGVAGVPERVFRFDLAQRVKKSN